MKIEELVSCMHHHHLDCAHAWNWCEKQIEARRTLACHTGSVHAKKLPNYPTIGFGVDSDTEDDLEIREGKNIQVCKSKKGL